jgi:glutamate dehydrogenase (NADP+)
MGPLSYQNEIEYDDAVALIERGVTLVLEGANMPTTSKAIDHLHDNGAILAPAKACNAGGVAVSGLEMAQNATMTTWSNEEVDKRLEVWTGLAGLGLEMGEFLEAGGRVLLN